MFVMERLRLNDFPDVDSGLEVVWELSGDTMKFIFQGNRTDFVESAHETADQFSTSFYGNALHGSGYEMEGPVHRIGGGDSESSWIATQVMRTLSSDGRVRRWQWEMRKRRRPPGLGTWFIESIGSSDKDGDFEPE